MRRLHRYLLSETMGPLALGFVGYTFILLMQFLFRSAEMIIRRGVPAEQVGRLLLLSLPNILVLTIPMSLLFAILVSIGKLSSESELTAMRASGVSLLSLYRPILALSLLFAAINTALMLIALPWGNSRLQKVQYEILTSSLARQIEPRIFYDEWEGLMLYVFEMSEEGDVWNGVFLADTETSNQVTVAERGRLRIDGGGQSAVLELENAVIHELDFSRPDRYALYKHKTLDRHIQELPRRQIDAYKSLRELTVPELLEVVAEPDIHPTRFNLARVEIHKKFSIPAACLVFALIGVPLGFSRERGGRAYGFAISVGVIMAYYVMLNNGEEAARVGRIAPWLAMWLPNIVFTVIGFVLLLRKNRDKSLILGRLDRWVQTHLWPVLHRFRRKRKRRPEAASRELPTTAARRRSKDVVVKVQRPRLRFPNTMDRYIGKMFLRVFGLVIASCLALLIVADLTERSDHILRNDIAGSVVLDYYKYASLQMLFEMAPLAVLITVLVIFGLLARNNEVIAAMSLGTSLYRLSIPALVAATLVVVGTSALVVRVLPAANQRVEELNQEIRGNPKPRGNLVADRNWLFGQGRYIYNYLHYDERTKRLQRLQVLEFDEQHRLVRRLYADSATYLGEDRWRFDAAWTRTFTPDESGDVRQSFDVANGPVIDRFPERPEYFESEYRAPLAMGYRQLERYIREVKASGQTAPALEVELHNKVGYPATCLVMAFVALPFSFRLGRRGALYGIGIGVALGILFLSLFALSRTLGEAGALPAALAVWSPSIAFTMLSIYMFLGVET